MNDSDSRQQQTIPSPFERLVDIMSRLRAADGCPWDRQQTPDSLIPYLAEESCEVIDAISSGRPAAVCEELGDLLLQVVFQAQIYRERGDFNIDDVAASICRKLERRHPHVFGDHPSIDCPEEQSRLWNKIKQQEKKKNNDNDHSNGRGVPSTGSPELRLALSMLQQCRTSDTDPFQSPDDLLAAARQAATITERNAAIDRLILALAAWRNRIP